LWVDSGAPRIRQFPSGECAMNNPQQTTHDQQYPSQTIE
jgi:hypothetical protein